MKYIVKSIVALLALFAVVSCENNFLDINEDPNRPKEAEYSKLLTFGQQMLGDNMGTGIYTISRSLASVMHQTVSRETPTYSMGAGDNGIRNSWNRFYLYTLPQLDAIINNAEPEGNTIYAGIAKVLKAYNFSVWVDLWGDVPYSESNNTEIVAPKVDLGKDIYIDLFVLLDAAIDNLDDATALNFNVPDKDDLFYGGDKDKWIRLANTIKLKLLLQTRLVKSDIPDWNGKLSALITANNFIESGEDFQFWYTEAKSPEDERHPVFTSQYPAGQKTFYISPWLYEIMKGETLNATNNPFANIVDPRTKYFIIKQATPAKTSNEFEYRNADGFISIFFGTSGGSISQDSYMALPGIYACGGKYDNNSGASVGESTGTGITVNRLVTYYGLKFMLAELALQGDITSDPRAYLQEGIEASVDHVNFVSTESDAATPTMSATVKNDLVTAVLAKYDAAANNEKKLEIIITQKWIANFFAPIDCYNDYRRTGYPILFDPNKTTPVSTAYSPIRNKLGDPGVPDATAYSVTVNNIYKFQKSLYYQSLEESYNPNITQKADPTSYRVFWDTRSYEF